MRYLYLHLVFLLVLTAPVTQAQNLTSADEYSQRGIAHFEKNDFEAAISDFTKAIDLKSRNLEFCFYFRGMARYRLGRIDDAIGDLSKAIELKQHPRFYDDRGNLLVQKADFEGALADLSRAIELEPKYAKAYGDRGIVRIMRGDDSGAEQDFEKCYKLDPKLAAQFRSSAEELKLKARLRTEQSNPSDVEILKFSWAQSEDRVLINNPRHVTTTNRTAVSQTGLQVLGSPTDKGQPGPPGLLDPSSSTLPPTAVPTTAVRGVNYRFTAVVKNAGNKTIHSIHWAYVFYPKDKGEPIAYTFVSRTDIAPGKDEKLTEQVPSEAKGVAKLNKDNRALFDERIVVLRLVYADGSFWQSSGEKRN